MKITPDYNELDLFQCWPYASDYVSRTLDPEAIENHAVLNLCRGLAVRRLVAFLGAGVSMAYGRISWQDLVLLLVDQVKTRWVEMSTKKPDKETAAYRTAERLYSVLKDIDASNRQDIPSDRYPMIFEICEKLEIALTRLDPDTTSGVDSFRHEATRLTLDAEGHAREIIESALREHSEFNQLQGKIRNDPSGGKSFWRHALAREHKGVDVKNASNAEPVQFHHAFRVSVARQLASRLETSAAAASLQPLLRCVAIIPKEYESSATGPGFLQPTHRFIIGNLLQAFPVEERLKVLCELTADNATAPETRDDLIPMDRDPLAILHGRVGVRRFITTNYDKEIETFLASPTFNEIDPEGVPDHEPAETDLEATLLEWKSHIFAHDNPGHLVSFAVDNRSNSASVMHLHGRADDHKSMVVTETDYQQRYLKDDSRREIVDNAIRLAFSANPILFVGSNMGEDDIMRPLRQFVSSPLRARDRQLIALIPATKPLQKRLEEKVALLGRYGVYAIHFGAVEKHKRRRGTSEPVMWLPWFWEIKNTVEAELNRIISLTKPAGTGRTTLTSRRITTELAASFEKIKQSLLSPPLEKMQTANPSSKNVWHRNFAIVPPHNLEGIDVSAERRFTIDFEVSLINAALSFFKARPVDGTPKAFLPGLHQAAQVYRHAVKGAGDAVLSAFTCARLLKVQRDYDTWRREWLEPPAILEVRDGLETPPPVKQALNEKLKEKEQGNKQTSEGEALPPAQDDHESKPPTAATIGPFRVAYRHALLLAETPTVSEGGTQPGFSRFYANAPSETLEEILWALKDNADSTDKRARVKDVMGRRVFLFLGSDGTGRGHLLGSLQATNTDSALLRFLAAVSRDRDKRKSTQAPKTAWVSAVFCNLSYSHEAMSIFDRIIKVLIESYKEMGKRLDTPTAASFETDLKKLEFDRIGTLRFVLEHLAEVENHPKMPVQYRVLVVINGINVLFDADGQPKNGQVKRLFNVLLSDLRAKAPIDLVLLCRDGGVPSYFRKDDEHALPVWSLERRELAFDSANTGRISLSESEINFVAKQDRKFVDLRNNKDAKKPDDIVVCHFLKAASPVMIALSFFSRVPSLLAWNILHAKPDHEQRIAVFPGHKPRRDRVPNIFDHERGVGYAQAMVEAHCALRVHRDLDCSLIFLQATVLVTILLRQGWKLEKEELDQLSGGFNKAVARALSPSPSLQSARRTLTPTEIATFFCDTLPVKNRLRGDDAAKQRLVSLISEVSSELYELIHHLYRGVSSHRFMFTILLSNCQDLTAEQEKTQQRDEISIEVLTRIAGEISRFLERTVAEVSVSEGPHDYNSVIKRVLDLQSHRHARQLKLPIALADVACQLDSKDSRTATSEQFALQMEIIWALALIGQPVPVSVLAACPRVNERAREMLALSKVQQRWNEVKKPADLEAARLREELIEKAIEEVTKLAVNRCQVFSIRPASPSCDQGFGSELEPRHGVHRLIQSFVFNRLGARNLEVGEVDRHTLSLFSSQPNDMPSLEGRTLNMVRNTVAELALYPDSRRTVSLPARSELSAQRVKDRVRAALGIIRSAYSIGVLAHADVDASWDDGPEIDTGYFEDYRRLGRWLLRLARAIPSISWPHDRLSVDPGRLNCFYAEEIVWLFNECGVLSLAQGRLSDAIGLFREARSCSRKIEPEAGGALQTRIALNRSIVDIERGELHKARRSLARIRTIPDRVELVGIGHIASGYLGLIEHLAGNFDPARQLYDIAIKGSLGRRRLRVASIFCRYFADLKREAKDQDAAAMVEKAIRIADEGGHEDILKHAMLSRVAMDIAAKEVAKSKNIQAELDSIESYARKIGVARLLSEVNIQRARLMLDLGESRLAANLSTDALQIATMQDMRPLQLRALLLLGEAYLVGGHRQAVQPIVLCARSMARKCEYHNLREGVRALEAMAK